MTTTIIILIGADPTHQPPPEYQPRRRRRGYANASVLVRARNEEAIAAFHGYLGRRPDREPQILDSFNRDGWVFASVYFRMKSSEGNAESDVIPELNRAAEAHKHVVSWSFESLVIGWEPRE